MKKHFKIFIISVMIFLITGCGNRNMLSIKEFSKSMEGLGYVVEDVTEKADNNNVACYYVALSSNYSYHVEYYGFNDVTSAKKYYNDKLEEYKSYKKENMLDKKIKAKDVFYDDETYAIVSRIKNTVMFTYAEEQYKDEINRTFEEINY